MPDLFKRLNDFVVRGLWDIDVSPLGVFRAFLVNSLRLLYVTIREFSEREITLRATSLVYITLLSLVPLLAFSFSLLKAFGVVDDQLEPFLNKFLEPLGTEGKEITQRVIQFVGKMKVGVLGIVGLLTLIYTVVSLIQKIEDALNHIWKIHEKRSLARRLSDYISIFVIGPLLIFAAFGLTASLMSTTIIQKMISIEPLGAVLSYSGKLFSYILVCAIFTCIYTILPNTKVRFYSALLGGVIAGVLWQTTGWVFASFVASSRKYAAIYSGFAVLILFMIWLYLNWLIFLVGAEISFCHQNLKFLTSKREVFHLSNKLKERLSLFIMYLVGYNYYHNKHLWTLDSLVNRLGLPEEPILDVLTELENKRLILETGEDPPSYLPARDIGTIKLKEVLDSVRENAEDTEIENKSLAISEVDRIIKRIDEYIGEALGDETVKSLLPSKKDD